MARLRLDRLVVARAVALAVVVVMIFYFTTTDAISSSNPFLVPDALLTVLLLVCALLPRRFAEPALIFSLAWAAAVYTVSLCTYAVRGEFAEGADHFALIIPAVLAGGYLALGVSRRRAG
jgi:hypothetical protein